ncbi:hypothetical protein GGI06_001539 [Coemansia sp. S85]|nr:hypothetical protein GGI06_001539 [Coemansia sp. S85]
MAQASTFQRLPGFILKKICQYTTLRHVEHRKPSGVDESFRFTYRTDLFNSLCKEWTEVASELYFRDYTIDVLGDQNDVNGSGKLNVKNVPLSSFFPLVKRVCINLDLEAIFSGRALDLLKNSIYSAAAFPIARTAQFTLMSNFSVGIENIEYKNAADNLNDFVEAMKPMFPKVVRICVLPGVGDDATNSNFYARYVQFVELVCSHNWQSAIEVDWPTRASQLMPTVVTGLSALLIDMPNDVGMVEALVHQNASTLSSLRISNPPLDGCVNVFETPCGKAVFYPMLEKLAVSSLQKVPKPNYSLGDAPVLLPRLADLAVLWGHPFHDDVLFRGNNATLKRVLLMLDEEFMVILNKFKVFGVSNRPKLKHATLWNNPLGRGGTAEQSRLFNLLALSMASKVQYLVLQSRTPTDMLVSSITQQPAIATLQCLKLINSTLSFGTLLALIESLPLLSEIALMKLVPEQKHSEMDMRTLLEHLIASYRPLSNRLQYVKYCTGKVEDSMDYEATCSMFLALLCPRFTRFVVNGWLRKKFNRGIRNAIKTEPFINYAERLGRLAFNDVGENNMKFKARPLGSY